jgi:hypothetical protein
MHFSINKSSINEVRDQLSLDYADDNYLNIVAQNLGLHKHLFSFDDDIWRALVKTLALDYKQISNKFKDVLEILFGPKYTQVGTLSETAMIGDTSFFMNDTSRFPQIGTFIFDEGLATEETIAYRYIDRRTNEVFLRTPFTFNHPAHERDVSAYALAVSSTNQLVCSRADTFPITGFPYTVVICRGTPDEAVYYVTANEDQDPTYRPTLILSGSPYGTHALTCNCNVMNELAQKYFTNATLVVLDDSSKFPPSGLIKLFPTFTFTISSSSSGLSSKTLTVAGNTFVLDTLQGYEVVFTGNVTVALKDYSRRIISNDTNTITIDYDFTEFGDFPHIGDTFKINPIVHYTNNEYENNALNLHRAIPSSVAGLSSDPSNIGIILGSKVEVIIPKSVVELAPVKFTGSGWDIIQSTPRLVELYIPLDIRGPSDLRSSSYLHDDSLSLPISSVTQGSTSVGATQVFILPSTDIPDSGVVQFVGGETVAYGKPISFIKIVAVKGDSSFTLKSSLYFPLIGQCVINQGSPTEETIIISNNDIETGIITIVGSLLYDHEIGEVVKHIGALNVQTPLVNSYAPSSLVSYFSPIYGGTDLPKGDYNATPNTYPGPYLYDFYEHAPSGTISPVHPSSIVPGPTLLSIDQTPVKTAIEVESALAMMMGLSYPFSVSLGRDNLLVTYISLASRVKTTVAAPASAGDFVLQATLLNVGGANSTGFSNGNGYRILINEGAVTQEVAYVTGVINTNTFLLESPLYYSHLATETITLMADVLTTTQTFYSHTGLIDLDSRSTFIGGNNAYLYTLVYHPKYTTKVRPQLDCIPVSSVSGFNIDEGTVLLNFGSGVLPASNKLASSVLALATSLPLTSASSFPSTYPYEIVIAPGTRKRETLLVTQKVANSLTLGGGTYGTRYAHAAGTVVSFTPGQFEVAEYQDIDGNELCFEPLAMLDYTHYPIENVIDSPTYSDPREDGFSFPLRMPVDLSAGLKYILDLIRAAGVKVEIISKR